MAKTISINPPMNIDFDLLKKQKSLLLSLINSNNGKLDELNGVVNILDAMQDHAIDDLGFPEEEIL